jgi:ribosomal protein L23
VLNRATGTHKVTFDVKELWQKPEVKRPFEIVFSVDQLVGTWGVSVMAATTDPTLFFPGPHR